MKIIVLYNLPTERVLEGPYLASEEDTRLSAIAVSRALKSKGAKVKLVPVQTDNINLLKHLSADLVFNLIEWTGLELPFSLKAFRLLEQMRIPFTGAGSANYLLTSDKLKLKSALRRAGLPTAPWQAFRTGRETIRTHLPYPLLVKLALEHCSIGLLADSVVTKPRQLQRIVQARLFQFQQPVIAEEFLSGREFQVTVISTASGIKALPPAEIIYREPHYRFLTYAGRWEEEHPEFQATQVKLASVSPALRHELASVSLEAFHKLNFRDYARMDLRCRDSGEVVILEANSNPGLDDHQEYGLTISFKAAGFTFADFVWEIVQSALRRFTPGKVSW